MGIHIICGMLKRNLMEAGSYSGTKDYSLFFSLIDNTKRPRSRIYRRSSFYKDGLTVSWNYIFQKDFRGSRGGYFIVSKRVRLVYIIFTILWIIIGIMFFNRNHPFLFFSIFYSDRQNKYVCLPRTLGAFLRENILVVLRARFGLD